MKSYVINLKRRPERLQKFLSIYQYSINTLELFEAFDGKNIGNNGNIENIDHDDQLLVDKFSNVLTSGEIGCFISHLKIWQNIVNNNIEIATIYEDDCIFTPEYKVFMDSLTIPDNVNLLYPGGRFKPNFVVPNNTVHICNNIYKHNYNFWNNALYDRTTHCYIITYKMANFLINLFNIYDTICKPVDKFIIEYLQTLDIPVYSTYPHVCWSPAVGDSDIR